VRAVHTNVKSVNLFLAHPRCQAGEQAETILERCKIELARKN
jgi:hypothetical protein